MKGKQATMLQFDWEEVEGATITGMMARGASGVSDGSLQCEQIAVVLGPNAVVMRVNDDTDEVIVSLEEFDPNSGRWLPLDQLDDMVSRRLGWCWIGRNYRGYLDTFTVGVDGIDAAYSFTGKASSLECARVIRIRA